NLREFPSGTLGLFSMVLTIAIQRNRPPDERRPIDLTKLMGRLPALMEKESDTRTHQLLTQSAILPSVDLGALIIEVFILNKRAELGRKKVIGTGKRIER